MNEVITPELSQLPALPVEEVKQTVDKVGAYVNVLAAAKKAATDQNTINEIDEQIRKYSAFKIRCQMELGERTAKMEKNTEFHGNQHSGDFSHGKNTKTEKVSNLGLTPKQAWQNEQLVKPKNRPIVEHYLERSERMGDVPTTNGALKEIYLANKPKKDERLRHAEAMVEATKPQEGKIASIQMHQAHKQAEQTLLEEKAHAVYDSIYLIIRESQKLTDDAIRIYQDVYSRKDWEEYKLNARSVWDAGNKLIALGRWTQEVNKR